MFAIDSEFEIDFHSEYSPVYKGDNECSDNGFIITAIKRKNIPGSMYTLYKITLLSFEFKTVKTIFVY